MHRTHESLGFGIYLGRKTRRERNFMIFMVPLAESWLIVAVGTSCETWETV